MCKSHPSRLWLRTAMVLQRQYQVRQRAPAFPGLPSTATVQRHLAHWQWARISQFPVATQYCREALQDSMRSLIHDLTVQLDNLRKPVVTVPALSLLYEELASLADEFEEVEVDLKNQQIAVQTERIVLEEFDLGPFEIRLLIKELGEQSPYSITALDPNDGASSNPHPHVQGISLCEGEGKPAIAAALQHGRISEFFVLVRQILRTYNEQSAYRQLGDWHGVDCAACGDSVSSEDAYSCDSCRCSLCHDCEYSCNTCHSSMCYECRETCSGCDDYHCADCLTRCRDCGQRFCHDCHTDGRCSTCLEAEDEIDEANEVVLTVSSETEPEPAVHADSLGQAAVPA
jgi:hypothetical protein